jgi:uncharacterized cupin superfamily protein
MADINDPKKVDDRTHPGFRARRGRLGWELGTERLGLSVWEVPPGEAAYPYHFHLAEEEVLIVLEGQPSLRTADGWRALHEGEAVAFPQGEAGAHQIVNWTDATVRFLAISTSGTPDVVLYPDSGKVGAFERLPDGPGLSVLFRAGDAVDYHEGEAPPNR